MNNTQNRSILFSLWCRLPVIVRSVLAGSLVAIAGTLPWALLVRLNIDHMPSVPWSVFVAVIWCWLFWKYIKGKGWPRSTATTRKNLLRANPLSSNAWGAAILAGILGLVSLLLFSGLYGRMVRLPQQDTSELVNIPTITLVPMVLMGSVIAGVVEESAFRGYMQKPIEQRHGPWIAILITGIIFGLMHFSHPETTWGLMPFYFFVSAVYGMLAYITKSILPGMVLHAAGDVFVGLQLVATGQSEWQTAKIPQPLIWESGTDSSFWLLSGGLILLGSATVYAYKALAKEMKKEDGYE